MHSKEGLIFYALTAALLIVAVAVWYFQFTMKRQYLQYMQLQKRMERSGLETQEAERRMIASDLHDEVGTILLAINHRLSGVIPDSDHGKKLLAEAMEHLKLVYEKLTSLSSWLVPLSLSSHGPLYAFREFVDKFMKDLPLKVELNTVDCGEMDQSQGAQVFRMLQEILQNTIKHSEATVFRVTGTKVNNELFVTTEDNGKGFLTDPIGKKDGQGLHNLANRAEIIGAKLVTTSIPGEGTRYFIQVPIKANV
jgi:signal transduction histidine kinase